MIPQAGTTGEWPEGLYEAEVQVAAFQNGYFAALCNRVGTEGDMEFAGESFVCGPDSRVLARAGSGSGRDSDRRRRFDGRRALARAAVVLEAPPARFVR